MPDGVQLRVLGGFALTVGGAAAPELPRKTRALLSVLAVDGDRPVARDRLGELLWPGRGPEQIHHSLRQALYALSRTCGERRLVASRDRGLVLAEGVASDIARFRRHLGAGDDDGLRAAVDAYGGGLLDGFPSVAEEFDTWAQLRRAALEAEMLATLARLGDRCTASGDAEGALAAAERMFAIDRVREETHWRLLEAYRAAGRRAEALRRYEDIVEALKREVDAVPGLRTRELVKLIRTELDPPAALRLEAPEPLPASRPPPLAVLPFAHLGGETVPSHLADGLMVDIVCQLAGLRELQVISHGSTLGYRDPAMDPRLVGQELAVRYVVRGSMRRQGEHLRLTTELADAGTGTVVWARTHDTSARLDFAAQDRLVAQIVNTLAPRVHELELQRIRGKRPESLSVYEKVLLAREQMLTYERPTFAAARALLDAAVADEPTYGEAHALLADWHSLYLSQGWATDRTDHVQAADRANELALLHDQDNARALIMSGHRRAIYHRDYAGAQQQLNHALAVVPSLARAWLWSSYTYAYIGAAEEAIRRATRALELSPRDREAHDYCSALCVAHYTAGDYDAAVAWGLRCMAQPSFRRSIYGWTAAALAAAGRLDEARDIVARGMAAEPTRRVSVTVRNHAYSDPQRRHAYGAHLLAAGFPP